MSAPSLKHGGQDIRTAVPRVLSGSTGTDITADTLETEAMASGFSTFVVPSPVGSAMVSGDADPPFGVHSVDSELVGNGNMDRLLVRNLRESRSDFSFTFLFAFLADVTNRSIVKC